MRKAKRTERSDRNSMSGNRCRLSLLYEFHSYDSVPLYSGYFNCNVSDFKLLSALGDNAQLVHYKSGDRFVTFAFGQLQTKFAVKVTNRRETAAVNRPVGRHMPHHSFGNIA